MPMAYSSTVIIDLVEKERAKAFSDLEATPQEAVRTVAYLNGQVATATQVLRWFGRD